jgi:hypothetical protein
MPSKVAKPAGEVSTPVEPGIGVAKLRLREQLLFTL